MLKKYVGDDLIVKGSVGIRGRIPHIRTRPLIQLGQVLAKVAILVEVVATIVTQRNKIKSLEDDIIAEDRAIQTT